MNIIQRPAWRRLTVDERRKLALYAQEHGINATAEKFVVSPGAIRRACALNGILPMRIKQEDRTSRIATAKALIRSLGLTPQDLLE